VTLTVRESEPVLTDLSAAQAAVQRILSGPIVLTAPEFEPWTIEPAALAQWLVLEPTIGADGQPTLAASLNRRRITELVEQLAPQVARDPRNAKFRLDVAKNVVVPVVESIPGQSLDITMTVSLVEAAAASEERSVTLPFVPIPPAISTKDVPDVRSFELISEGVTNFSGSSSARVKNITWGPPNRRVAHPAGRDLFL
jgi:vancomycin resistance protein YoaR